MMRWLRASLYQTCPEVKSLPPLDMSDHIMVSRQNLQMQLVPRIPSEPDTPSPTYMVQQAQQVAHASPAKNKSPEECWDLQASSLYRLAEVQGTEELP